MTNGKGETIGVGSKEFGGNGQGRRNVGYIMILADAVMGLLHGFGFYTAEPAIIWAIGIIGLGLLISGIAKDVVALGKSAIS